MKRLALAAAGFALAFAAVALAADPRPRAKPGDAAPDFTVKTLDGKERNLAFFRGDKKDKIVVVNFWSHACPWSRAWDAELSKIAKDYASKNVVVVSIDANKPGFTDGTNSDTPDDIRRYSKEKALAFEVYLDPDHKVANAFGGQTTPDVFVIGTDGKVVYTGRVNDMESPKDPTAFKVSYLRDALDAAAAGKTPAQPLTPPAGCSIKRDKKAAS